MLQRRLVLALFAASAAGLVACSSGSAYGVDVVSAWDDAGSPAAPGSPAVAAVFARSLVASAVPRGGSCMDRESILAGNRSAFDARRDGIQAAMGNGVTPENWSTFATADTWGPRSATFDLMQVSAGSCANAAALTREYYLAVVDYWVEQGMNYCHHHVPGWTPPDQGAFRNSTGGSTSGGKDAMTCTANRFEDGHQRVQVGAAHVCSAPPESGYCDSPDEISSEDASKQVKWNGVDCSDFTSWAYDFAGITSAPLSTGIGAQACSSTDEGAIFDIEASNLETALPVGGTLESHLLPGDMLYILAVGSPDVAHVVTWTGLHWNDLAKSSAAAKFDPAHVGEPGSRLGGDFESYGMSVAELEKENPYMIVDSHYAGPAYRPFIGWYKKSLSHVRRVIDAKSAVVDQILAPYRIQSTGDSIVRRELGSNMVEYDTLVAPVYASAPPSEGHRFYAAAPSKNSCLHPTK